MRVAVTGSTGHIGSVLVPQLVAAGHDVRALVYGDASVLDGVAVERVTVDVRDRESLDAALAEQDVVIHLAAFISVRAADDAMMHAVNVDGVRHVAEAALAARVGRMVHVSSVHAYRTWRLPGPLVETDPAALDATDPIYDRTKALGEVELRKVIARGLNATILNPVGVIGPSDHLPSLMGATLRDMYTRDLPLLPSGGFCWVDVRDVADAALMAMTHGAVGANHLLSGGYLDVKELHAIVRECGGGAPLMRVPTFVLGLIPPLMGALRLSGLLPSSFTADALYALRTRLEVDASLARTALSFEPRCVRQSVRDGIAWWRETGALA